jgi:hypothetical protein
MKKKSQYLRKQNVLTVWQCPFCKRLYRVKASWMEKNGTPICDYCCGEECCFSHVLVKRAPLKHIVLRPNGDTCVARNGKGVWGTGSSRSCAIGDMIRSHQELFGVKVSEGA